MSLWEIHPRDADLGRTLDPVSGWTELVLVERFNLPDTWTLTGPVEVMQAFEPGMGCLLDLDGEQVASGQARTFVRTRVTDPESGQVENTLTVGFVSDLDALADRLCWPVPSHALTTSLSTFAASHDVRTGPVETVLLGYVGANAGPAASIVSRRTPTLALPTSLGRGGSTTVKARMDNLGTLVHDLAEAGRLRVNVAHDESTGTPRRLLTVDAVPDVSADVVFGDVESLRATAFVTDLEYRLEAPSVTDAILFAAGDLEARQGARFTDESAVSLWGRRKELLIDQRQTDDVTEIARAGAEALEEGASPVSLSFSVADSADIKYRRDYGIGWKVGVELPGLPPEISDNVVREVTTTVRAGAADEVVVAVGSPGASSNSTNQARLMSRAFRRIDVLERGK